MNRPLAQSCVLLLLPILLLATLLALALVRDNTLGRLDGFVLLSLLCLLMWWIARQGIRNQSSDALTDEYIEELPAEMPSSTAVFWLLAGLILLTASSKLLVWGAVNVATELGVSELIIGLTIIAFGTSAPELVVSGMAAYRGNPGLAVGNAIGSNIANIGLILGLTAIVYPLRVESETLKREYPMLMLIMIASFIMAADLVLNRTEGVLLLTGLVALVMLIESVLRLIEPQAIHFDQAIAVAFLGLTINFTSWFRR